MITADGAGGAAVYPRPRGGAVPSGPLDALYLGLSPPTRGSLDLLRQHGEKLRSIPAHAGEPKARGTRRSPSTVYPRPRGGAEIDTLSQTVLTGLSPPTRGSPLGAAKGAGRYRSIPAHAGEPSTCWDFSKSTKVYPRPRGGAQGSARPQTLVRGLSPPTRGSQHGGHRDPQLLRSIPAHAGEPQRFTGSRPATWVYPRPRGGASTLAAIPNSPVGLSPPTRGSLVQVAAGHVLERSIPAHAGEPVQGPFRRADLEVYPRPRGGAPLTDSIWPRSYGLSPPTRGSRESETALPGS